MTGTKPTRTKRHRRTAERKAKTGQFVASANARGAEPPGGQAVAAASLDPMRVKARHVVERLGGPTATARIVGVAKSQPSRWVKGEERPSSTSRKHLLDLEYVLSRLDDLYRPAVALGWLESPNAFLGGARPLDVLLRDGPAPVIEAIDASMAGSYA